MATIVHCNHVHGIGTFGGILDLGVTHLAGPPLVGALGQRCLIRPRGRPPGHATAQGRSRGLQSCSPRQRNSARCVGLAGGMAWTAPEAMDRVEGHWGDLGGWWQRLPAYSHTTEHWMAFWEGFCSS